MKTLLARIICLFMVFPLLFASTGFSTYEHLCKIKGIKTYSLSTPKKSCCVSNKHSSETSKKQILKRAKCCSDQVSHYKINPNAAKSLKIAIQIPALAWKSTPLFNYPFTHNRETLSVNTLRYSNNAFPISGRDRLVFVQSFLI